ncbi:SRPBCC domain-containing protein [Nocardioides carbamazepini]|uniref:SRPBCC domain-containing protein n=1 Tax=Nocardioides carbamazepini TaxID=2854259 RepID=UPI00214A4CB9|nr:SRPBCC domain-containing protein [Nocardioides carbamazepini]MCR1783656.1 SRPBCC domain-containing protein [Nocardioides carbamazepini]
MNPSARIDIDAPLDVVWEVMTDTERYAEWNPFVERAETAQPPLVGNPIVLHVVWATGGRTRSPERITALDAPTTDPATGTTTALMSYVYEGLPAKLGLVKGVRHQRLTQRPGGPTTYETVEEFRGPLVRLAGPGRVADGFRRHAEGLKAKAEQAAASRPEG